MKGHKPSGIQRKYSTFSQLRLYLYSPRLPANVLQNDIKEYMQHGRKGGSLGVEFKIETSIAPETAMAEIEFLSEDVITDTKGRQATQLV